MARIIEVSPIRGTISETQIARVELDAARLFALNRRPFSMVGGEDGVMVLPEFVHVHHRPAASSPAAFTVPASIGLDIRTDDAKSVLLSLVQANVNAVIGVVTEQERLQRFGTSLYTPENGDGVELALRGAWTDVSGEAAGGVAIDNSSAIDLDDAIDETYAQSQSSAGSNFYAVRIPKGDDPYQYRVVTAGTVTNVLVSTLTHLGSGTMTVSNSPVEFDFYASPAALGGSVTTAELQSISALSAGNGTLTVAMGYRVHSF